MVMMVDSGADISLLFTQPFVEKQRLLERVSPSISTVTFGVGGQTRVQVGRLEEASLGPIRIQRPVAGLSLQDEGTLGETGFAGILGAQVLSRLKVRLDYGGGWMTLQPGPRLATLSDYDKSGLVLIDKPPEYKRFEVVFVVEGSPAAEAGLRKGDQIVSINHQPSEQYSLPELKSILRKRHRKFDLSVRREGKSLSMNFVTRTLI
jgi:membrane-associated protease RseP (regulator of RpoE activity)